MAEKLSIQIALEGGAEIERQLASLGETGKEAFGKIGAAAEKVGGFDQLKPEEITNKLQQMGVTGADAINKIQNAVQQAGRLEQIVQGVKTLEQGFEKLGDVALKFGSNLTRSMGPIGVIARAMGPAGIAAAAFGAAMVKSSVDAANAINEVAAAALKLGVTVEQFNKLRQSFEGMGLSSESARAALQNVKTALDAIDLDRLKKAADDVRENFAQDFISDAARVGLKELQEAATQVGEKGKIAREALVKIGEPIPGIPTEDIRQLGVELAFLKSLGIDIKVSDDTVTQINKIREALAAMPDSANRTKLALQFLGETPGTEFIQGLKLAEGSLDESERKAAEFSRATKAAATEWNKFNSLLATPALTLAIEGFTKLIAILNQLGTVLSKVGTLPGASETQQGLQTIIDWGNRAIATFAGGILRGAGVDEATIKKIQNELEGVAQKGGEVGNKITRSLNTANAALNTTAQATASAAQPFVTWEQVLAKFGGNAEKAAASLQQIQQAGTGAGQAAQGFLTWEQVLAKFGGDAQKAAEHLKTLGTSGQQVGTKVASGLQQAGTPIDALTQKVKQLEEEIKKLSQAKAEPVKGPDFDKFTADAMQAAERIKQIFAAIDLSQIIKPPDWSALIAGVTAAVAAINQALAGLGGPAGGVAAGEAGAAAPAAGGAGGFAAITTAIQQATTAVTQFSAALTTVVWDSVSAGAEAWNTINTAIQQVSGVLSTLNASTQAAVTGWNALVTGIQQAVTVIQEFASSLGGISFEAISGEGVAAWKAITSAIQEAIQAIKEFMSLAAGGAPGGAAGGPVGGLQHGGLLGGRGTGTSDSNLVRVSRGEYIMPARAMRQPGVLAFLEALRHSGGNLRDVFDDMGRFVLGGLVPRSIPAFATGGLAGGGMSNVTIQFPGLPEITGLRAPEKVVEELRKAAALAQVRSGGRKPSRYT